jgi:two-component system, chemotaxis family, sensor kinase CheA
MNERRQAEWVDEIASELVMAEASDLDSLNGLLELLRSYLDDPPADTAEIVTRTFTICVDIIEDIVSGSTSAPEASLQNVSKQVTELQRFLREMELSPIGENSQPKEPADAHAEAELKEPAPSESVPSEPERPLLGDEGSRETPPLSLVLPEWVDETTFRDFLSTRTLTLDEIESDILAIEEGDRSVIPALMREIHTIKGEAGALGLEGMESVCHTLEDQLSRAHPGPGWADLLLAVRDWLANAIDCYARYEHPREPAAKIIRQIEQHQVVNPRTGSANGDTPALSGAAETANQELLGEDHEAVGSEVLTDNGAPESSGDEPRVATDPSTAPQNQKLLTSDQAVSDESTSSFDDTDSETPPEEEIIERDEETVALLAEFLQEGEEGLAQVDAILMNIESQGLQAENIDAIFRVFHTIKGVAGFLELDTIEALAHTTENLLNQSRKGVIVLAGAVLDLVFDSTESMRHLLSDVREGVETSRGFRIRPQVPDLVARLKSAIDGNLPDEVPSPVVSCGTKVGEILVMSGATTPERVQEALDSQKITGRPIGEELVEKGAVAPRDVARAIRSQRQAVEPAKTAKLRETVKVDLERVDSLVEMVGELVIVESMLAASPELDRVASVQLLKYLSQLGKISRDLQSVGMQLRMIPLRGVFQKMARLVRDLSKKSNKSVRLVQSGESTEMDRSMVEQISDPLIHMIRNSVDHGIENSEKRKRIGKDPEGTIHLSAIHEGSSIVISIRDDGKGLDRDMIVKKAVSQGLIRSGDHLSDADVYNLIFAPGFSTAQKVTQISGRGVGMDVVKRSIDAMRGRISIDSKIGKGTEFRLILPLTLAIIDGMLVACGNEKYIIPTLSIIESIQPTREMLYSYAGRRELVNVRGEIMPLMRLYRLLGVHDAVKDPTRALIIVIESLGQKIGLMVDDVLTQQQVVIKNLGSSFKNANYLAGATILSDGRAGLILNVDELGELAKSSIESELTVDISSNEYDVVELSNINRVEASYIEKR